MLYYTHVIIINNILLTFLILKGIFIADKILYIDLNFEIHHQN